MTLQLSQEQFDALPIREQETPPSSHVDGRGFSTGDLICKFNAAPRMLIRFAMDGAKAAPRNVPVGRERWKVWQVIHLPDNNNYDVQLVDVEIVNDAR